MMCRHQFWHVGVLALIFAVRAALEQAMVMKDLSNTWGTSELLPGVEFVRYGTAWMLEVAFPATVMGSQGGLGSQVSHVCVSFHTHPRGVSGREV